MIQVEREDYAERLPSVKVDHPGSSRSQGTTSITDRRPVCAPGVLAIVTFCARRICNSRLGGACSGCLLVASQARDRVRPQRDPAGRFTAASTWSQAELTCPALTRSQPSMAQSKTSAGLAASGSTCSANAHTSTSWSAMAPVRKTGLFRDARSSPSDEASLVTRLLWTRRLLTPGLVLEEMRDSSPIARPEQGIFRIGRLLLSRNPSARSRQAGTIMVLVRLKTDALQPPFSSRSASCNQCHQQHGRGPGYKVIVPATIEHMTAPRRDHASADHHDAADPPQSQQAHGGQARSPDECWSAWAIPFSTVRPGYGGIGSLYRAWVVAPTLTWNSATSEEP